MFRAIFQRAQAEGITIQTLRGEWQNKEGVADNYMAYRRLIAQELTQAQAAFRTPTGQLAAEQGFKHAVIIEDGDEGIEVLFSR